MIYHIQNPEDTKALFAFYNRVKGDIPYWFDVDFDNWHTSMFDDTDYDSQRLFRSLHTCAAVCEGQIAGFIQFGIASYFYEQNGEKNETDKAGIIRNLYFRPEAPQCGQALIQAAEDFFSGQAVMRKFAFFHALGMTCNACHGKLHTSQSHIEQALSAWGYGKEHENVYYKKMLCASGLPLEQDIALRYSPVNPKGLCGFSIFVNNTYVGAGEIAFLPQGSIAYLKWIYIEGDYQRKGYASGALERLFADLYAQGILRLDTDTADGNLIAQKLYEKTGFANMGRTRSFLIPTRQE